MTTAAPQAEWQVAGASVKGTDHVRRGLPNQDAWAHATVDGPQGRRLIVALADGHGSQASYRSAEGARLAVDVFLQVAGTGDWMVRGQDAERALAEVSAQWRQRVQGDWESRGGPGPAPWVAYGSTLLGLVALADGVLVAQLGDGDILELAEEGGEARRPLPPDERLMGNETTSLAAGPSAGLWRWEWREARPEGPDLLYLLATDGYGNSFRDDAGFRQVPADVREILRHEGLEVVTGQLDSWLREASSMGSGDDVTAAFVWRPGREARR